VYAKGQEPFDFGILILKVNRTFVMKKITLRGPKLPRSSHPIVVLCRTTVGLISESDDQNLATLDLSHTPQYPLVSISVNFPISGISKKTV
jgi:hypothetical protein